MKALVLENNAHLVFHEVPTPVVPESWYLVRVVAAGICGSDLHRGFESGAYHYPLIMGHEFSGVVESAPLGGRYLRGARVAVFPLLPCRNCRPCSTGDFAQCASYDYFGSRRDGAFAELIPAPEANLFAVPENVPLTIAAMTEPCAVALHAVRKLNLQGGETAVVFGAGPIGNMVAQWLSLRGCSQVMLVDIDAPKLELARSMGFLAVNSKEEDPVKAISSLTGGEGAELVVEAVGLGITFRQALQASARFGQVVFLGNASDDLVLSPVDMTGILRKELTIRGTWNSKVAPQGNNDWTTVLEGMKNTLNLAPLISHNPPLSEGGEVFSRMYGKKESFQKVLFRVTEE